METKIGQPVQLNVSEQQNTVTDETNGQKTSNTIFAIPKDFEGHIGMIQRNAINSWMRLGTNINVILLGRAVGIEQVANDSGAQHIPDLQCNHFGTPLISSAFHLARNASDSEYLTYVNCDIILLKDFQRSIERIINYGQQKFLAIGRRTDLEVTSDYDFTNLHQVETILNQVQKSGRLAPLVCKDFFVFQRSMFVDIPEFAVGRGNWDNWVVHSAHQANSPVIDLTPSATAIHQNHDYDHIKQGGRMAAYVTGDEAKANESLAGGKHIVTGCASTHVLTPDQLKRRMMARLNIPFWTDMPNFLGLLRNLFNSRHSMQKLSKKQTPM